ncbi:hypothetical protein B0H17DRAFT_1050852 [Mycena rosella]|uniref:Uncharacterized protein n=1 Tax=Mycena rosella TaxID=1033263 RepID=A0AAD7DT21_MYCRO|nr:hypothetical protein B0H17DRAFT_1050852 [Mycena rosella]
MMPSPDLQVPLSVPESFQALPPPALSAAQSQIPSMPSESSSAPVPANVEFQDPVSPQQQFPEPVSSSQESPKVPKLTLHRLFSVFTVVGFLIPKDVTSAIGLSMVSLHLDWVGSTIALFCVVCEYYVGVTPPVWEAWLHVDRSSEIRLVGYGLSIALVVAVYGAISYAGWELAQHLTARHGFDLATALFVVAGGGFWVGEYIVEAAVLYFGLDGHQLVWIIDCLGRVFAICCLLSLVLMFRHPILRRIPRLPIKVSLTLITALTFWSSAVLFGLTLVGEGNGYTIVDNNSLIARLSRTYIILVAVGFFAFAVCTIAIVPTDLSNVLVVAAGLLFTPMVWLTWKKRSSDHRMRGLKE